MIQRNGKVSKTINGIFSLVCRKGEKAKKGSYIN